MASLILFTQANSPTLSFKILAAAKLAGVSIDVATLQEDSVRKSPSGKIPFLETEHGVLFEANAIARYVARQTALLGANPFESALIDSWIEFASFEIDLPASVWVFPVLGFIANNAAATSKAKVDIRKAFEIMNKHLGNSTYFVGQRLSLADIVIATSLLDLYKHVLDPGFRKAFGNVNRWFLTIVNHPALKPVFGDVVLAEKASVAADAAHAKPAKEQHSKEEKPKEAKQPKKAEKPKPAEEEADDEDVDAEDEKPKAKNPLDLLPASSMVMDEWKRTYSNNDTRAVALPWFWSNFDSNGYSLWWCRYKYNHELEVTFKTANFLGGFLQRLDKLRKYGFGSLIIFGQEPTLEIEGVWLVRGKTIPAELSECDDFVLYDWKEVDISNEDEKRLFEDFLAWDGEFAARSAVWGAPPKAVAFNEAKIFK